jgi:cell division protein FtsB
MEQKKIWKKVRNVLINKYTITLYVFAVIFIFVGEQSWIKQISRKLEMREIQKEIKEVQQQTAEAATLLHSLNHPDSLERFAREQYKMHTDKEDVYIVE